MGLRSGGGIGLALATAMAIGGCASKDPSELNYNLLFTEVSALEYGRMLCQYELREYRHTCVTQVLEYYRDAVRKDRTPDQIVNGPFLVFLDRNIYRGRYVSQPFAAAFTIGDGGDVCRGRYNAFAGSNKAVFQVFCDSGSRGSANIILDEGGRNGIGRLWMDDGRIGDIVFGYAATGGIVFASNYVGPYPDPMDYSEDPYGYADDRFRRDSYPRADYARDPEVLPQPQSGYAEDGYRY